jgi:gamma-glutamylaminecyclotransferase
MIYYVAVFGTLKSGFPLHDRGLSHARFVAPCRTVRPYPMLVAGPRFAPMILNEPGSGYRLEGELYAVDSASLSHLDQLESVGEPGNFRASIEVEDLRDGACVSAFVYMKARELATPAHTDCFAVYQLDARFVPPT